MACVTGWLVGEHVTGHAISVPLFSQQLLRVEASSIIFDHDDPLLPVL
jgi:hypothetical protein